jgi:hypothetical protein
VAGVGEQIPSNDEKHAMRLLFSPVLANLIRVDGSSVGILLAIAVMVVIVFR